MPFSSTVVGSADIGKPPNGEICMDKSHLLTRTYTSVPIEAAKNRTVA